MARFALAVLLVVVSALPVRTQDAHPAVIELLTEWVAAVQAHTPGKMDDAAVSIAAWNRSELLLAQPFVRAIVDPMGARWRSRPLRRRNVSQTAALAIAGIAPLATSEAAVNDFIKRAALLHTDAVLLADLFPQIVPPPKSRARSEVFLGRPDELVIARGPDGRFANFELGNLHWDYARDLLDAVTPTPATDATVALWYRAVMATFASSYSFGEALPHVSRARQVVGSDPGVLFGDAAIQETLASPRIQDYVRVTTLPNEQKFLFVTSGREHLELSESLFRRALQGDPTLVEARIRLARVVSQRGKHEEALAVLKEVSADALEARDESAFLTFDRAVSLRCPMSANAACLRAALDGFAPAGQTALVDGAFSGIVVGESEVGRSLLMVFSDGIDTASYMTPALVLDAARQSDVVAYAVTTGGTRPEFIDDLAEITGGRVLEARKDADLSPTFRAVLDEFRYRYLVTYTPTGVPREGWHKLDVRVKRPGARVRARPGYQGRP